MYPQTKLLVLILSILIMQFYCTQISKYWSGYDCNTTLITFQSMFINMCSICNHLTMRLLLSLLSHPSKPDLLGLLHWCLKWEGSVTTSKSCPIKVPLAIPGENKFQSSRIHSQRLLMEFSFDSFKSQLLYLYSIPSSDLFIFRNNLLKFPFFLFVKLNFLGFLHSSNYQNFKTGVHVWLQAMIF